MTRWHVLVPLAAAALLAPPLAAQMPLQPTNPQFQEVVRLDQEGYPDSARALIAARLARLSPADSSYPEALYTAAIVARSGDETREDYVRITVDYPHSRWADKALLRLAQLDYGTGNLDAVEQRVARLFSDYPASPILATAALWGARAAFERQHLQLACTWLGKGLDLVGDDIELRNQLTFAKQRCVISPGLEVVPQVPESLRAKPPAGDTAHRDTTQHAAQPRDTTQRRDTTARGDTTHRLRADTTRRAPADAGAAHQPPPGKPIAPPATVPVRKPPAGAKPAAVADHWRVQVAAISDRTALDRLLKQLKNAGYKAYQLSGPRGLTRVQVGPYASRDDAAAQVAKLRKLVGGTPYVTPTP